MVRAAAHGRPPVRPLCQVLAILVAACVMFYQHGCVKIPAPMWSFAPCSLSNSLSSYGQYQALRYVSFPLQTLSKSTKARARGMHVCSATPRRQPGQSPPAAHRARAARHARGRYGRHGERLGHGASRLLV